MTKKIDEQIKNTRKSIVKPTSIYYNTNISAFFA